MKSQKNGQSRLHPSLGFIHQINVQLQNLDGPVKVEQSCETKLYALCQIVEIILILHISAYVTSLYTCLYKKNCAPAKKKKKVYSFLTVSQNHCISKVKMNQSCSYAAIMFWRVYALKKSMETCVAHRYNKAIPNVPNGSQIC